MKLVKKRGIFIIIIVILTIVIALLVYFNFIYQRNCSSLQCFNSAMLNCDKAVYISDTDSAVWKYTILESKNNQCIINTKIIQLKEGSTELLTLEGKSMACYVPLGFSGSPSQNLVACHGILKEEMQDLLIKRLHLYVTEHIGQISEELGKVI